MDIRPLSFAMFKQMDPSSRKAYMNELWTLFPKLDVQSISLMMGITVRIMKMELVSLGLLIPNSIGKEAGDSKIKFKNWLLTGGQQEDISKKLVPVPISKIDLPMPKTAEDIKRDDCPSTPSCHDWQEFKALSIKERLELLDRLTKENHSYAEIAKLLGVAPKTIYNMVYNLKKYSKEESKISHQDEMLLKEKQESAIKEISGFDIDKFCFECEIDSIDLKALVGMLPISGKVKITIQSI